VRGPLGPVAPKKYSRAEHPILKSQPLLTASYTIILSDGDTSRETKEKKSDMVENSL